MAQHRIGALIVHALKQEKFLFSRCQSAPSSTFSQTPIQPSKFVIPELLASAIASKSEIAEETHSSKEGRCVWLAKTGRTFDAVHLFDEILNLDKSVPSATAF